MASQSLAADPTTLERVTRALASVPRMAYTVPHVYPSAAPTYEHVPQAERPALRGDRLRLYVHVPFCRYHCSFCHYAVRIGARDALMRRYVEALDRELTWIEPGTVLMQLFVGGGTPTALPPALLDRLLASVFARARSPAGSIHTVETSPETISPAHVEVLKRHGIGRVSMGVQSLDAGVLDAVRRDQTRAQALEACAMLAASELIVNVDLIYGLPGQTEEMFLADLDALAEAGVHALTLYSLHLNDRTPVARSLRDDEHLDLERMMRWRAAAARGATALGYTQTRWHTFKRLDSPARRHERLPCFDEQMSGYQFGAGMSARSHLGYTVYRNHERLGTYLARIERGESPVEQVFRLDGEDRATQFIARTLGDGHALIRDEYAQTLGRGFDDDFGELVERLSWARLVADDGRRIALTEIGKLLYDVVTLAFYPQRARDWLAAHGAPLPQPRAEAMAL